MSEKMLRRVDVRTCLQLCDSHAILLNFLHRLFDMVASWQHVLTEKEKKQKIKNVPDFFFNLNKYLN